MAEEMLENEALGYDYVDGRNARRQGKSLTDNPNSSFSPQGKAWVHGWQDRNEEIVREKNQAGEFWVKVTARRYDVHVCLKDMPEVWGAGHSINEALGEFVRTHAQRLGIRILFTPE